MSVAERRTPWSIEVVVDRFVKKRRDAPRIELACGDFGLRPWGIRFPSQSSYWNYIANEGLSLMTYSQASKAMNSSVGREARGGCASMMSDGAKP